MTDSATNPQGEEGLAPEVETPEAETEEDQPQALDPDADPEDPENPEGGEDDHEDVQFEGKAYRVPKPLKEAFLRHQDYTRKTQELAENRRGWEQQRETQARTLAQQQETLQRAVTNAGDLFKDRVKLGVLQQQIAEFDAVSDEQWIQAQIEDPNRAALAQRRLDRLRNEANTLASDLIQREQALTADHQRASEQARQGAIGQGFNLLANDPDVKLTKESFGQLASAMEAHEFRQEELFSQLADPRVIKFAMKAVKALEELPNVKKELAAYKKAKSTNGTQPVARTGGNANANARKPTDASGDGLSVDEWMRRRNASMRQPAPRKRNPLVA